MFARNGCSWRMVWLTSMAMSFATCLLAQESAPKAGPTVDESDDLFEGLAPRKKESPAPRETPANSAGEDVGRHQASDDPLARVERLMQRSHAALTAHDFGEETRRGQQEIIADLDRLLNSLSQQGKKSSSPAQKKLAGENRKPEAPSSAAAEESSAARESAPRLGPSADMQGERITADEAFHRAWGHLPPKLREAMQNAGREEFLPKYSEMIEEFYRRLAGESDRNAQ